jgi:hypothetical protein
MSPGNVSDCATLPAFFALVIFQLGSHIFCPGWPQILILLPMLPVRLRSQAWATTTGLLVETRVSLTFCQGGPRNTILWISAFLVARNYRCDPRYLAHELYFSVSMPTTTSTPIILLPCDPATPSLRSGAYFSTSIWARLLTAWINRTKQKEHWLVLEDSGSFHFLPFGTPVFGGFPLRTQPPCVKCSNLMCAPVGSPYCSVQQLMVVLWESQLAGQVQSTFQRTVAPAPSFCSLMKECTQELASTLPYLLWAPGSMVLLSQLNSLLSPATIMIIYQDFISRYVLWHLQNADWLCPEIERKMVNRTEGNVEDSPQVEMLLMKALRV